MRIFENDKKDNTSLATVEPTPSFFLIFYWTWTFSSFVTPPQTQTTLRTLIQVDVTKFLEVNLKIKRNFAVLLSVVATVVLNYYFQFCSSYS